METSLYQSYRNSGRFYVECSNDSKPSRERWFYDQEQHRLLGYDKVYGQFLGSFGPNEFTSAGERPTEFFDGALRHRRYRWSAVKQDFLAFPSCVYRVDFAGRKIKLFFRPAATETVAFASWWRDELERTKKLALVSTDRFFHFLTEEGATLVSIPRVHDCQKDPYLVGLGLLENPKRYMAWYRTLPFERKPGSGKRPAGVRPPAVPHGNAAAGTPRRSRGSASLESYRQGFEEWIKAFK
jgi:hypothetical protein